MMAMAEQEELNHLFSDSLTDEDLLRAVEQIESYQMSTDRTVQRSDINDATVESTSNLGTSAGLQTQNGKFIISFEYLQKLHTPSAHVTGTPHHVSRRFRCNFIYRM